MSTENDPKDPKATDSPPAARPSWAWPVAWIATVAILMAGGVYVFKSCRDLPGETITRTGKAVEQVGQALSKVAAAFNQGTIKTTFTSYATEMSGNQFLQVATINQRERFTRTDEATTAFGYLPLPDVIVEADAPVTYTYYLDLNDPWEFTLENGEIIVTAPDIKYNKPAVDVSRMTYEVKKDSYFRKSGPATESLKSSITWMAHQKAKTNIELVRDTSRKQTELFVRNWLAKSFADGKNYPVTVHFRGEVKTNAPLLQLKKD
jgi:hypothetical protein